MLLLYPAAFLAFHLRWCGLLEEFRLKKQRSSRMDNLRPSSMRCLRIGNVVFTSLWIEVFENGEHRQNRTTERRSG